jgi:hypothetical protein
LLQEPEPEEELPDEKPKEENDVTCLCVSPLSQLGHLGSVSASEKGISFSNS